MGRRSLLPEGNYNLIESLNQYQKFSCLKALECKRYFVVCSVQDYVKPPGIYIEESNLQSVP